MSVAMRIDGTDIRWGLLRRWNIGQRHWSKTQSNCSLWFPRTRNRYTAIHLIGLFRLEFQTIFRRSTQTEQRTQSSLAALWAWMWNTEEECERHYVQYFPAGLTLTWPMTKALVRRECALNACVAGQKHRDERAQVHGVKCQWQCFRGEQAFAGFRVIFQYRHRRFLCANGSKKTASATHVLHANQ